MNADTSQPTQRRYGSRGPYVIALHGGPGAPGTMAPVARVLADRFRVIEPFERRRDDCPLTLASHLQDLHALVDGLDSRPALVGSSWGAMLALAFAAQYPETIGAIVLIGCGTFDETSRAILHDTVDRRLTPEVRRALEQVPARYRDSDARLAAMGCAILSAYSYELHSTELELERCDALGHEESWNDMLRAQREGLYPAAFEAIRAPVLMLHGADDPHPGPSTRDVLARHIRDLEYVELPRCGHYPWLERHAHDAFFRVLIEWLNRRIGDPAGTA